MRIKAIILMFIIGILFIPVVSLSDNARIGELFETADDIITAIRDGKTAEYEQCLYLEILYNENGVNIIPQYAFMFFPNVQELRIEAGVSCADYSSITKLKNLDVLVLESACQSDIDFVKELTNLRRLALPHNHIDNGEPISYLHKLEFLNLEDNDLSDIAFVTELKNLTELIIQDNKEICDITPLSDLIKLEGLFISNTSITDISTLRFLINLNALEMYGNKISDLKPLAELKDLEWLDARDNNIVDVSPLCELENLEFLYLSGNPISNLEVLKTLPLISIEDVLELPVF